MRLRPDPDRSVLLRPRVSLAVRVAFLLCFCVGFADGALTPFFALWAEHEVPVAPQFVGLLLACYSGGELLATPLVGGIADRLGRRRVLAVSTFGVGLGFVGLHFVHGAPAAALVLVAIGVFESVLHPTISTVIADSVDAAGAREAFATARVFSNAGRIVGPAVAALLVHASLGAAFLGAGVALLLANAIVVAFLPETRQPGSTSDDDDDSLAGLLPALRDPRLAALLVSLGVLGIASGWIGSVLPLQASDSGVLTTAQVGWLFTYEAALVVAFQRALTRRLAQRPGSQLVVASGLLLAAAFGVLCVGGSIPSMVCGVTLLSVAQMLLGPLVPAAVNELAPPSRRATYMAAVSVMADVKDTVGPAAGTSLYAVSARLPWLVGIPVALGSALALAAGLRRRERQE